MSIYQSLVLLGIDLYLIVLGEQIDVTSTFHPNIIPNFLEGTVFYQLDTLIYENQNISNDIQKFWLQGSWRQ